jgi:hypothetical protein
LSIPWVIFLISWNSATDLSWNLVLQVILLKVLYLVYICIINTELLGIFLIILHGTYSLLWLLCSNLTFLQYRIHNVLDLRCIYEQTCICSITYYSTLIIGYCFPSVLLNTPFADMCIHRGHDFNLVFTHSVVATVKHEDCNIIFLEVFFKLDLQQHKIIAADFSLLRTQILMKIIDFLTKAASF